MVRTEIIPPKKPRRHGRRSINTTSFLFGEGVFCERCEVLKTGSFVLIQRVEYSKVLDSDLIREDVVANVKVVRYCLECFRDVERSKSVVYSGRDIYIRDDLNSEPFIKALFDGNIEKTDKTYVLIPTEVIQKLVRAIPENKLKELTAVEEVAQK